MKSLFLNIILFVIVSINITNAQLPTFQWAKSMGGLKSDLANSIAVDASGNVYTVGSFSGTADFDPGPTLLNFTNAGQEDIFISKLDANGNYVWAKTIGLNGKDRAYSIALDASGNVYVTGVFDVTVDFDPGPGTFTVASNASSDAFILKLTSAGNFVWVKTISGASDEYPFGITVDGPGNVYTTGYIYPSPTDFDPGPGTYTLGAKGIIDIFVLKLNSSGNFVWAKLMGGLNSDAGIGIDVDAAGNVYTTGFYEGPADMDPGGGVFTLNTTNTVDIFISKLDASGNFVWAKGIGSFAQEEGYSVVVDPAGNVYATGRFAGTADFDPGPGTYTLPCTGIDIFVLKLNTAGNFVWARAIGTANQNNGQSICMDGSNNLYTTGYFDGIGDFDSGPGTYSLTSSGNSDVFILKLDTAGNFIWAQSMGGAGFDQGMSIAADAVGNVYTAGFFTTGGDYDPGTGVFNLTSAGSDDIFVQKLSQSSVNVETVSDINTPYSIFPNPIHDKLTVTCKDIKQDLQIFNILGELIYRTTLETEKTETDLSMQPQGIYFVRIGSVTKKIIKE